MLRRQTMIRSLKCLDNDIFRLYLQMNVSGILLYVGWMQVSKQSYRVTSSRINRLRPRTLKCSMQDRQNVVLLFSQFIYKAFFCHSSMLGEYTVKWLIFVQLFTKFKLLGVKSRQTKQVLDRDEDEVTCILKMTIWQMYYIVTVTPVKITPVLVLYCISTFTNVYIHRNYIFEHFFCAPVKT